MSILQKPYFLPVSAVTGIKGVTEKGISQHFEEGNRSYIILHLLSQNKLDEKTNGFYKITGLSFFT